MSKGSCASGIMVFDTDNRSDREGDTLELEADHRRHVEIEHAIRDLRYGVGGQPSPSRRCPANAACQAIQVMAHNLARWTTRIGLGEPVMTTKTLRRRFSPWPDASPAKRAGSPCVSPRAGLGKTSSAAPWPDCAPCHYLPDHVHGVGPPTKLPNCLADPRQAGPRVPGRNLHVGLARSRRRSRPNIPFTSPARSAPAPICRGQRPAGCRHPVPNSHRLSALPFGGFGVR